MGGRYWSGTRRRGAAHSVVVCSTKTRPSCPFVHPPVVALAWLVPSLLLRRW